MTGEIFEDMPSCDYERFALVTVPRLYLALNIAAGFLFGAVVGYAVEKTGLSFPPPSLPLLMGTYLLGTSGLEILTLPAVDRSLDNALSDCDPPDAVQVRQAIPVGSAAGSLLSVCGLYLGKLLARPF